MPRQMPRNGLPRSIARRIGSVRPSGSQVVHARAECADAGQDDGVGGVDPSKGSGLSGLQDRVAALAGTLTVDSTAGEGTRICAEIPLLRTSLE